MQTDSRAVNTLSKNNFGFSKKSHDDRACSSLLPLTGIGEGCADLLRLFPNWVRGDAAEKTPHAGGDPQLRLEHP